jgi:hypothetical protein
MSEAQSLPETKTRLRTSDQTSKEELWSLVKNDQVDIRIKTDALTELVVRDDPDVPAFLVSDLARANTLPEAWRDTLILATEEVQFSQPELRTALQHQLFQIALTLRDDDNINSEPALWAALRRCASLMPEEDASHLLEFLSPEHTLDTRQVALQGIQTIFSFAPPGNPDTLHSLCDRVADLVRKYLDPDLLTPGENASLAVNALHALAVLGDERVIEYTRRLAVSQKRWLIRFAKRTLERTAKNWQARQPVTDSQRSALRLLTESLATLDQSEKVNCSAEAVTATASS